MATWNPQNMPSQAGRLALVTGANSGIGFWAAQHLAKAGATVILACRDLRKAEQAKQRMVAAGVSGDALETAQLDLADLDAVRAFAQQMLASPRPLHLLINNAGVMALPRRATTPQGFELQFGTNYLGHFALTGLLLPLLLPVPGSRIVTVSSIAHKGGFIDFGDLQGERKYTPWKAYRQSKLADLLFALELERRLKRAGKQTESIAAHPGVAATNLFAAGPGSAGGLQKLIGDIAVKLVAQSEDQGSWPTLYAATAPEAKGGGYYGPDGWREMKGDPVAVEPSTQALDQKAAARLWSVGEALTGVHYAALDAPSPQ